MEIHSQKVQGMFEANVNTQRETKTIKKVGMKWKIKLTLSPSHRNMMEFRV
jgi:hypothetical protein